MRGAPARSPAAPLQGVSAVGDMRFKWADTVRAIAVGQSMQGAVGPGVWVQVPLQRRSSAATRHGLPSGRCPIPFGGVAAPALPAVWVNGRAIKPGATLKISGGSVRFLAFQVGGGCCDGLIRTQGFVMHMRLGQHPMPDEPFRTLSTCCPCACRLE